MFFNESALYNICYHSSHAYSHEPYPPPLLSFPDLFSLSRRRRPPSAGSLSLTIAIYFSLVSLSRSALRVPGVRLSPSSPEHPLPPEPREAASGHLFPPFPSYLSTSPSPCAPLAAGSLEGPSPDHHLVLLRARAQPGARASSRPLLVVSLSHRLVHVPLHEATALVALHPTYHRDEQILPCALVKLKVIPA